MAANTPRSLSSPGTSPSYGQGAVPGVKPQATNADYSKRLSNAYKGPGPTKGKLPKVAPKVVTTNPNDKAYQDLMNKYKGDLAKQREAARNLYRQNRGALENDLNTTRQSINSQRGTGLEGIAQDYAARGIGRSSGVYQQAGTDYEGSLQEQLKNAEKSFGQQAQQEDAQQKESVAAADTAYSENLVNAAKRKSAAADTAKAKKLPQATPQTTPKKQSKLPSYSVAKGGK